jgi:HAD superfamily hydrolase (TIGR01509 family)
MFDAVLFDLDGTLIDTESIAMTAGLRVLAEMGHPVDSAFMHGLVGKAEPQTVAILSAALPLLDIAAFDQRWRQGFQDGMAEGLSLKAGALDLLTMLSHPMAIVTSSGRHGAHHKLGLAGIAAHFREVITLDDVSNAKPAPDPYLLAAHKMGVDPARCLVFEDSDVGAESAHRAGCVVVQVPDVAPVSGRFARHTASDLIAGARLAGLI